MREFNKIPTKVTSPKEFSIWTDNASSIKGFQPWQKSVTELSNINLKGFMEHTKFNVFTSDTNIKRWKQEHPFHLVDPSPWPILTSLVAYQCAISLIIVFHNIKALHLPYISFIYTLLPGSFKSLYLSLVEQGIIATFGMFPLIVITLFSLLFILTCWFKDIVTEATYLGEHTKAVQKNILFAFALFISSEVMFFFGFFWAYFHMALNPAVSIGCSWPPLGIEVLDIWELPFLNTVILLSSGVSVTLAHRAITMPLSFEKKISNSSKLDINPLEFNLNSDVVNLDSKYKNNIM
jgi:hypothetical protein